MPSECSRCGERVGPAVHTNPTVGFSEVCNACQQELHMAYNAAQATRRAEAIAGTKSAGGS